MMFPLSKSLLNIASLARSTNVVKPIPLALIRCSKLYSSNIKKLDHNSLKPDNSSIIHHEKTNMPVQMKNPYSKEKQVCILCKLKITPNYKNVRLLSQFVSRFTGRVYGRHITGLCKAQQERLEQEIRLSHQAGLMPAYFRDPRFAHDPLLFDPDNPFRPHRY